MPLAFSFLVASWRIVARPRLVVDILGGHKEKDRAGKEKACGAQCPYSALTVPLQCPYSAH